MAENPQIFLEYVQTVLAEKILPGQNEKQDELLKILKERNEKNDLDLKPNLSNLPIVVKMMEDSLYKFLPLDFKNEIKSNIAIGCLETGEINAACIKKNNSDTSAIVVNQGLMIYLNKLIKYFIAARDIEQVEYCNRLEVSELNKEILIGYALELGKIYEQFQVSYGPIILLKDKAQKSQSLMLHISELFVLCHELGHYFNGDLIDEKNMIPFFGIENVKMLHENQDHKMEYNADIKGFELMQYVLKKENLNESQIILPALVQLFNGLWFLSPNESETHPDPISRVLNIADRFYGKDIHDNLKESYSNPELLMDKDFLRTKKAVNKT